jgi:hypothetical protein
VLSAAVGKGIVVAWAVSWTFIGAVEVAEAGIVGVVVITCFASSRAIPQDEITRNSKTRIERNIFWKPGVPINQKL